MRLLRKNRILLLEVLIAFAIVATCALPLIYPQIAIYKAQKQFEQKVDLDHAVNLLYGEILRRLYLNEIPWADLQGKATTIDEEMLRRAGVELTTSSYTGFFKFTEINHKPKLASPYSLWLFNLSFTFSPKRSLNSLKPVHYEYKVFIVRNLSGEAIKG